MRALALLSLLLVSCEMAPVNYSLQDLERLADSRAAAVAQEIASQESAEVQAAIDGLRQGIEDVKAKRAEEGKPEKDPITWEEWILYLAGSVGVSIFGTNKLRNWARDLRGEPVSTKKAA